MSEPIAPQQIACERCRLISNERLASYYIWRSGKTVHASDCATSCAPAEVPGPCDCIVPESQPSPSGDVDYRKLAQEVINVSEESLDRYADVADWLRSHDAKVSGQAEQRLRLQEAVHELIAAERKLLPVCPIVTHHKSDCVYCDLIGKRISVEAALQESPSD